MEFSIHSVKSQKDTRDDLCQIVNKRKAGETALAKNHAHLLSTRNRDQKTISKAKHWSEGQVVKLNSIDS